MKNNTPKITKLIYGVGINDAAYTINPEINGKVKRCPFYSSWVNMLTRCYSEVEHARRPSYIGCTVDSKWLTFSSFSKWMENQDWKGKQLDKDILIQGNKVYSPSACIFVSAEINSLLNEQSNRRGLYPRGVSFYRKRNKYRADCKAHGNANHLGYYDTPEEAHQAYKKFKYKYIAEIANQQSEPLRTALLNYVIEG
jgi:hypothetical protein